MTSISLADLGSANLGSMPKAAKGHTEKEKKLSQYVNDD